MIDGFAKDASANALNTWCYEYLDKRPMVSHANCDKPFSEMNTKEIISEIVAQHGQVIELYRYLFNQAATASSKELLAQLIALEEHESMRMVQSANRLEDV